MQYFFLLTMSEQNKGYLLNIFAQFSPISNIIRALVTLTVLTWRHSYCTNLSSLLLY